MSRVVFDSSAVLTAAFAEQGADTVLELLPDAMVGTVNLAEVLGKLARSGLPPDKALKVALSLSNQVVSFDLEQAGIAASLLAPTHHLGLSLGDRACLALAMVMQATVYTADRAWSKLDIGIPIRLLR